MSLFQAKPQTFFASLAADDFHASDYFVRAGISSTTAKDATNVLAKNLKADGFWAGERAVYPIAGGTASSHAANLIAATFTITWTGSPTHDGNGVTYNGSSQFGNTNLNPNTSLTLRNLHASVYSGTQMGSGSGDKYFIGAVAGGSYTIIDYYSSTNKVFSAATGGVFVDAATDGVTVGLLTVSRTSSTALEAFRGSSSLGTNTATVSVGNTNANIYLSARNNSGTTDNYNATNGRFYSFGDGISSSNMGLYNSIILRFETTLGRQ